MFCINVVSVFSALATTYRDDYKRRENLRYNIMAVLVLHDGFL